MEYLTSCRRFFLRFSSSWSAIVSFPLNYVVFASLYLFFFFPILGLSFPHCHSFVTLMLNKETKETQQHSNDSSLYLNNFFYRTYDQFFMKNEKPTRKRQRVCNKKVRNSNTSLGNLTLEYLATQFYCNKQSFLSTPFSNISQLTSSDSVTCLKLCTLKCIFLLKNFFLHQNITKVTNFIFAFEL
jgi:hypothetical protein